MVWTTRGKSNVAQSEQTSPVHEVSAWLSQGVLLERYCFAPQLPVSLPPHSHGEYQVGLSLTDPGEYRYRGGFHPVPVGSLSVIHPGELHGVCGLGVRSAPSVFVSFYVPTPLVQRICGEAQDRLVTCEPYVPQPIILNAQIEQTFRHLHVCLTDPARLPLEHEGVMANALFALFRNHAGQAQRPRKLLPSDGAVRRVREFLDAHHSDAITYEMLTKVSGLSAFHLSRLFRRATGVPPHRYQLQRRIDRAKVLLVRGNAPAEIAGALGFNHQSHFGEQFRRLVGVPPGRYLAQRAGI